MISLHDLQTSVTEAISSGKNNLLENEPRWQIYRNNRLATLSKTLTAIYPAVQKIVGDDFFASVAHHYIQTHPSTVRNLDKYGDQFADFIAHFPPAKQLPYLSEVAQLEWARHSVFQATNAIPFDLLALQAISEDQYDAVKFRLQPASQLLAFQFPILRIWQLCQAETTTEIAKDDHIDLAEGGIQLLVIRRQWDVELEPLSPGEFALLSAFKKCLTLGEACQCALTAEPDFDVITAFKQCILQNTICL